VIYWFHCTDGHIEPFDGPTQAGEVPQIAQCLAVLGELALCGQPTAPAESPVVLPRDGFLSQVKDELTDDYAEANVDEVMATLIHCDDNEITVKVTLRDVSKDTLAVTSYTFPRTSDGAERAADVLRNYAMEGPLPKSP
jgi:hypothetical protein